MAKKRVETDANIAESAAEAGEMPGATATKPKKERKPRTSMISVWGETFHRAATEGLTEADVKAIMLEKYPEKAETVEKWTGWYKNYYNMGKIKGFENPVKVLWQSEAQIKRAEERAAKKVAREAAKAEKKQQEAQAEAVAQ